VTEDREQTSGTDREQYDGDREQWGDEVEGHGFTPQAGAGQQISATDDDDPDVEGHSFIGQTTGQQIGANTPEPTDQQTG